MFIFEKKKSKLNLTCFIIFIFFRFFSFYFLSLRICRRSSRRFIISVLGIHISFSRVYYVNFLHYMVFLLSTLSYTTLLLIFLLIYLLPLHPPFFLFVKKISSFIFNQKTNMYSEIVCKIAVLLHKIQERKTSTKIFLKWQH
jgi:hypothetical protein